VSHIGLRILADWLSDADVGVNHTAALLPLDGDDPSPPSVHIYDATRSLIVARGRIPHPDIVGDAIQFPAVLVAAADVSYDDGVPAFIDDTAMVEGSITAVVLLLLRDVATAAAAANAMYLVRAIRGSLLLFNQADDVHRTRCGVRLQPSSGVQNVQIDGIPDDLFVPQAFLATYPITEAVPAVLP
jgi:hypothetical protein